MLTSCLFRKTYILLLSLLVLESCKRDGNETKLQYAPDMADAPTVKPQQDYLDPPEGSVAHNAFFYPETIEESEKVLVSPYTDGQFSKQQLNEGKWLWNQVCITCHGADAKGEGYISDVYPRAPDLTAELYTKKRDGFFFYRITFGAALMPGYGHALDVHERWKIILYLRKLQGIVN